MKLSDFTYLGITVEKDAEFECACKTKDMPPKGKYLLFIENGEIDVSAFGHIHRVTAVITTRQLRDKFISEDFGLAVCDNPKAAFIKICNGIKVERRDDATAVGTGCSIANTADVPGFGVRIGNNVVIEDNVKLYSGVIIGDDCVIGRGAVLGCANYERCFDDNGAYVRAEHKGMLKIGNGVTIGENTMIDKALFDWDSTEIGDGCYIGRGSDISHGCKICEKSVIAHRVCICGNAVVGTGAKISAGAIVSNRVKIGEGAIVSIGSVVNKDVEACCRVTGNLAVPHDKHLAMLKKITSE